MSQERLPPGQHVPPGWPALHYGPAPRFQEERWDLRVFGATATGAEQRWNWAQFDALPRTEVVADLHCVTRFSVLDNRWGGVSGALLLRLAPPAPEATHVMVWAEFGYCANVALADFEDPNTLLVTHHNGQRLATEHGHPVRLVVPHRYAWKSVKWVRAIEYLTCDRRGFWEARGYHNRADPWRAERYAYQEEPGDGPPP
ncbi:molybdopterin-dependent oxidoreductase [Lipingzhangella sp. LS1_29]|uniref:Molybdopterin-dependent oxidoreductase n=1 Tax=Lipingzhangella rawalii TaxID=2055835 RepID=A0ABU2H1J5_9ACTN|nr:molybdopterin-dependent oxidoreductase [Lipingzhangella rawalii]MDS1268719.1 molybdopterin-dependent oxidoreductase [Lipingzhangella rawalii]